MLLNSTPQVTDKLRVHFCKELGPSSPDPAHVPYIYTAAAGNVFLKKNRWEPK